jgi:EmrB/QacA subfamily drug resistance transporter
MKIKMQKSERILWLILAVVLVAEVMDMLDSTITNIAAPTISQSLNGGQTLMQWLGTSYILAMGVFLVVGGRLGDKYGQRRIFLIGLAGFTLSSLACGLALNPAMMIVSRLLQGSFGALLIPQGMAIMTKNFPRDMMRKAFSTFGPVISISTIVGPVFAGFLIHANILNTGWRSIFLINIVIGLIGFVIACKVLPKDEGDKSVILDTIGAALLGGMMFFGIYGLISGENTQWNIEAIVMLCGGLVFFGLFVWRQLKAKNPIIKPSLFKNRGFTSGLLIGLIFFGIVAGLNFVLSLFLQLGLKSSPFEAAIQLIPMSLGIIVSSILTPSIINKIGRKVITIGLLVSLIGVLGMYFTLIMNFEITAWILTPSIFVMGLGMGFCFGTIYDFAIGDIQHEEAGSASGTLSAVQQLSGSIGIAVISSFFFSFINTKGIVSSMQINLLIIAVAMLVCIPIVGLLPKNKGEQEEH